MTDFEIWNYPHIDLVTPPPAVIPELECTNAIDEESTPPDNQELMKHLELAASISDAISHLYRDINEAFLMKVAQLIRKTSGKIIQKERELDPNHLKRIIDQALVQIQQDNEPCTIYVSTDELPLFTSDPTTHPSLTIKACSTLKPGDFRIKTAFSTLESILEEQLNALFGL